MLYTPARTQSAHGMHTECAQSIQLISKEQTKHTKSTHSTKDNTGDSHQFCMRPVLLTFMIFYDNVCIVYDAVELFMKDYDNVVNSFICAGKIW